MAGKRIGFVDHTLDNFHSRTFLGIIRKELADRGFEVAGAYATDREAGAAWAAEHGVPFFADPEALDRAVDCFAVLSPNNPEVHLGLCETFFPFGKTTYVDKTFAPDAATAEKIFALADRHGVTVQTSSALRYTSVQEFVRAEGPAQHVTVWGPGKSYDTYVIHPLEMAVSCLGHEVESVMRRGAGAFTQLLLGFSGGRTAVVNVHTESKTPYAAAVTTSGTTRMFEVDGGRLFIDMTAALLDFFESGAAAIDRRETMAIMRIMEAARRPEAKTGFIPV